MAGWLKFAAANVADAVPLPVAVAAPPSEEEPVAAEAPAAAEVVAARLEPVVDELVATSPPGIHRGWLAHSVAYRQARVTAAIDDAVDAVSDRHVVSLDVTAAPATKRGRGRPRKLVKEAQNELLDKCANSGVAMRSAVPAAALAVVPAHKAAAAPRTVPELAFCITPYRPRVLKGVVGESRLAGVLAEMTAFARRPDVVVDEETARVGRRLIMSDVSQRVVSLASIAHELNVPSMKVTLTARRLGQTSWVIDRRNRRELEELVARSYPPRMLPFYVDIVRYDATDMKVTIRGDEQAPAGMLGFGTAPLRQQATRDHSFALTAPPHALITNDAIAVAVQAPTSQRAVALQRDVAVHSISERVQTQKAVAKLMQTEQSFAMVIDHRDSYVVLLGDTVDTVTSMASGTGAATKDVQLRISGVTEHSNAFSQTTRLTCLDRASANVAAERALVHSRSGWSWLAFWCTIHILAGICTKTFSLVESEISGMINAALAMRNGASMSRFRRCLKMEIKSRFKLTYIAPSADALEYKRLLLRLFCANGSQWEVRCLTLLFYCTGDWRNTSYVEFYVLAMWANVGIDVLLGLVQVAIVNACCPVAPPIWPRSRWLGADLSADSFGLLNGMFGLFRPTMHSFVMSFQHVRQVIAEAADDTTAPGIGDDATDTAQDQGSAREPRDAKAWSEINAQDRRKAHAWSETDPFAMLVIIRLVLEVLRVAMEELLDMAGAAWELRQQTAVAFAMRFGADLRGSRKYRPQVLADMEIEQRAFAQLHSLYTEPIMYRLLPEKSRTVHFRALLFRLISRVGCLLEYYMREPARQFPIRIFVVVDRWELGATVAAAAAECPLMLDTWTFQLAKLHPTFDGKEFRIKILAAVQD